MDEQITVEADYKSVRAGGMLFQWKIEQSVLRCKVSGPTIGWVAVGFNIQADLSGTNLIMGCVEAGQAIIEDRYIVQAGEHKSKLELGSQDSLRDRIGSQENSKTTLSFTLPLVAADRFSHSFEPGKPYHVLLAYSWETDFRHHSAMRTAVEINL